MSVVQVSEAVSRIFLFFTRRLFEILPKIESVDNNKKIQCQKLKIVL